MLPFHKNRLLTEGVYWIAISLLSTCGALALVWALNTKINVLHYRALQCVYRDESSTFKELLTDDNCVSVQSQKHTISGNGIV